MLLCRLMNSYISAGSIGRFLRKNYFSNKFIEHVSVIILSLQFAIFTDYQLYLEMSSNY